MAWSELAAATLPALTESKALGSAFVGYLGIWFFCWRHGPGPRTRLGRPFADPYDHAAVVRFAGWHMVVVLTLPLLFALFGRPLGVKQDIAIFGLIAGTLVGYLHIRFRGRRPR